MKIMLIGHACGPNSGSEPAITWNWACNLARSNDVTVVTHPTERSAIEAHQSRSPNLRLRFKWISVPRSIDPWRPGTSRFIRIHYLLWQRLAMKAVRQEASKENYDYVHYISWNSVSAAPDLRKIDAPVVWGPVGGGQTAPLRFIRYFGRAAITELLRTARVRALPLSPRLRRAARSTRPALAINEETASLLRTAGATTTRPFLEMGISEDGLARSASERTSPESLIVAWAGRLEPHKALPLALEAVALTQRDVRLEVAGDGYMAEKWKRTAEDLGVADRVRFLGQLPLEAMNDLYRRADVFLFTSLRDSSGGVVFEAMAAGIPVVVPNHQGCATHVPAGAGIKYEVTDPRRTVRAIATALDRLYDDESLRHGLAEAGLELSRSLTWDATIDRFKSLLAEEGIR